MIKIERGNVTVTAAMPSGPALWPMKALSATLYMALTKMPVTAGPENLKSTACKLLPRKGFLLIAVCGSSSEEIVSILIMLYIILYEIRKAAGWSQPSGEFYAGYRTYGKILFNSSGV
jgi:hypothetical protein